MFNILALCAGNSSRSILAEAILNRDGAGRVQAWSAGSNPKGLVSPEILHLLQRRGAPINGLRSKGWQEFNAHGAPNLDLILSLCPTVSDAIHPDWPGNPVRADWPIEDPCASPPDQVDLACQTTYHRLSARINSMLALPFETMSPAALSVSLREIGDA